MKARIILLLVLPFILACGQAEVTDQAGVEGVVQTAANAPADEHCAEAMTAAACQCATFAVPELDAERAGELAEALAALPAVIKAKPDLEAGQLTVEFTAGEANLAAVTQAIQSGQAEAKLLEVTPVQNAADKSGCAGCPSRSACKGG